MSRGTRYKKNKKSIFIKKLIFLILFLFFFALFIISGFKIIKYIKDAKSNEKILEEISNDIKVEENTIENNNKYNIDFASLKEKNSDTVGFIKVNGTDIEHIVVKGTDNSYYLTHNFERAFNKAGWIFADYRNSLDGSDKNIILYGHNMRNNTMFGTLKNILNDKWKEKEENKYITFITENETATYEVFSVYQIEEEDYYITTNFNSGEFKEYIDTMKSRSKYNFNCNVTEKDSILTLSTCANNNKYRVILHAKKIAY